jgi:hypothetical protein
LKKIILGIAFVSILMRVSIAPASAEMNPASPAQVQYGFEIQDYKWSEFDDRNVMLVEETGYLYGVTCNVDSGRKPLGWRGGISLFGGEVDYDGLTWSLAPVKTDVRYLGARIYADMSPNLRVGSGLLLKTFFGIGFKGWLRELEDTKTQDGIFVSGAEEWWGSVYGRAGVGAAYPVSGAMEIFSEAGARIPIYTRNHANLYIPGSPSVDLEPEMRVSPFAEFGARWHQLTAKISYDALWFDKSDSVSASGGYLLHQPESESEIFTLSVAWVKTF